MYFGSLTMILYHERPLARTVTFANHNKDSTLSQVCIEKGFGARLTGIKLMGTTRGLKSGEDQMLLLTILPPPRATALDTKPEHASKPPSTALQQSPSRIPVQKLTQELLAAIFTTPGPRFERHFQQFDLQPGDRLVIQGREGVTVREGFLCFMLFEYRLKRRVEDVGNQDHEETTPSAARSDPKVHEEAN